MNMPGWTILYAALLICLGLVGYFFTDRVSVTALIPAFFGAVVLLSGLLAFKEACRKHAMHVAALLAIVGFLATAGGLWTLFDLLRGGEVERPAAAVSRSVMSLLSVAYFALCLRSFVKVRLARKESGKGEESGEAP